MNIPDAVIEEAAAAYFEASERNLGFDTQWDEANPEEVDRFEWSVSQSAPVLVRWALEEAKQAIYAADYVELALNPRGAACAAIDALLNDEKEASA